MGAQELLLNQVIKKPEASKGLVPSRPQIHFLLPLLKAGLVLGRDEGAEIHRAGRRREVPPTGASVTWGPPAAGCALAGLKSRFPHCQARTLPAVSEMMC